MTCWVPVEKLLTAVTSVASLPFGPTSKSPKGAVNAEATLRVIVTSPWATSVERLTVGIAAAVTCNAAEGLVPVMARVGSVVLPLPTATQFAGTEAAFVKLASVAERMLA